ncbi:MAG: type II secretion system F family protein [Actinobacteria bacterium]|nr:type II secretion system F family protein [Actinomycetota bacterium]
MGALLQSAIIGLALTMIAVGVILKARDREQSLADILDLPYGERDVPIEAVTETRGAVAAGAVGLAGRMVEQFDAKKSLASALERGRVPLKAGEYVVVVGCAAVVSAVLLRLLTGQNLFALVGVALAVAVGKMYPNFRVKRRVKAFDKQLPGALSLMASSLSAGHTFLRSMQMMCEEAEPPLSEEFARVVYETRLGDSVVDALDRMAERLGMRDLEWVVQAIRIQQTVGGKLAELLHTLADFIRSREDVRREVDVLTAEGRISAWVLGALPIALLAYISVSNPEYAQPLYHGTGLIILIGALASIVTGFLIIRRMVNIEV